MCSSSLCTVSWFGSWFVVLGCVVVAVAVVVGIESYLYPTRAVHDGRSPDFSMSF